MAQKWEYKFSHSINEKEANDLGDQGWELVSTDYDIDFRVWVLMFKRPKQ